MHWSYVILVLTHRYEWRSSYEHDISVAIHNDVMKWKLFPRYWPFVRKIHRSPVNSQRKGQWRGALMLSLICVWINGWVINHVAGHLRRHRIHYDVIVIVIMPSAGLYLNRFDRPCPHMHPIQTGERANRISSAFSWKQKQASELPHNSLYWCATLSICIQMHAVQ